MDEERISHVTLVVLCKDGFIVPITCNQQSDRFETKVIPHVLLYRSADKSLARPTSRCIVFDGENISFDDSLVMYINSTNIPPLMIINRIYENQNLLSLQLLSFLVGVRIYQRLCMYRSAGKSLAQPTSRCILCNGENISFDASLVIYINSTNIPPSMIINRIYETQNLLSLQLISFLVGLRTYHHP